MSSPARNTPTKSFCRRLLLRRRKVSPEGTRSADREIRLPADVGEGTRRVHACRRTEGDWVHRLDGPTVDQKEKTPRSHRAGQKPCRKGMAGGVYGGVRDTDMAEE